MAEQDGAAGQSTPGCVPEIDAENGEEIAGHHQPFFSMCQPLRSVSYSNSWEGVCAPAANDHEHKDGFSSVVDEPMLIASCSPENKQPQLESISNPVDGESKLCSPPATDKEAISVQDVTEMEKIMDDYGVPTGEPNEQPEPLSSKQPSSNDEMELWDIKASNQLSLNIGTEPCDNEDKQFPLSFSYRRQPQSVGAGLSNMGNTCFLNATLQCMTHTVPLFLKLRSADHSTPCSYNKDGFCSFCALKEHADESIRKLSPDFRPGQQEDAHEFLRCLLDNLHKCTLDPGSKGKESSFDEESMVKQVFGGQLKSQLSCCECGHCSETFEPFLDLSLEIDQVDNLVDALESFTKVEQIGDSEDKLTCEHCNAQVCKNKQLTLDKAPDVIAFQLKRFTTLDNSIEKIDKHVVYPSELDLKPYHSNPDDAGELKYDLYGVVEHSGLPNYGHYVCTIRSSPNAWHLMNDSRVDSITEAIALNQEAYILFYVRQGKFPWFSSLLEDKDALAENTRGASPVSVLENIDANCSMSSGEGSSSSSGDKLEKTESKQGNELEKDETSQYKSPFLPGVPPKRRMLGASNSTNIEDAIKPCRTSFQDDASIRYPCTVEATSLDRPSTPPRPKRLYSDGDLGVFEFEDYDDEETTPLLPSQLKIQPKVKKAKAASASKAVKAPCVDQNATRLMRGMTSSRRKGLLDCMAEQHKVEESRRCPKTDPLDKKKRKMVLQY
ncbi:hypothetical protein ACP70R_027616 [Stipagrostis hirtigluma subsp. patula]